MDGISSVKKVRGLTNGLRLFLRRGMYHLHSTDAGLQAGAPSALFTEDEQTQLGAWGWAPLEGSDCWIFKTGE